MCGVFAVLSPHRPIAPEPLSAALAAMPHRGPDGAGTWHHPSGHVALGHVRLAIRGDTAQPLCSNTGSAAVINGELYGTRRPTGASDSAALLPLIAAHGADAVPLLRGELALVAWDEARGRLLAARDPLGVRPLFVCRHGGQLLLASEVKALAAYGVPLRWDEGALMSLLHTGMLPQGRTLLAGISALPPGHRLLARSDGHERIERWWSPTCSAPDAPVSIGDLRAALRESVRIRLDADHPIGVALSGGIDSSLVLALAAQEAPVMAFSVGFAGAPTDELPLAADFARRLGVPFHGARLCESDLADHYAETVCAVEGPLFNTHAVARGRLAHAARRSGRRVLLTGDGGDELFGGYPHFVQDAHRARGDQAALERLQDREAGMLLDAGAAGDRRLPSFVRARLTDRAALRRVLSRDALSRWDGDALLAAVLDSHPLPERGPVERAMRLWSATVLPQHLLPTLGDRVEMLHSVEGRPPLLDARLAALAGRLREDQRVRGDTDKWALRQAAQGILPAALCARPKRALLAPPIAAHDGPMLALLQDTLRSASARGLPCFSLPRLRLMLDLVLPAADPAQARAMDPFLNAALSLAILGRELRIGA